MDWFSSIFGSIISALASWLGYKKDVFEAKNSKEVVANEVAKEETERQDEVENKIEEATKGNETALEDLRRLSGD